ncbi:MAG TPA: hypothetical protein VGM28_09960 [Candidatus Limnocylindrales bacterium]|jgi:hypothetical protein
MDHRGLRARLTGAGCTSCGAAVSIDRIAVLADRGDLAFIQLDCSACGSRTMSLVINDDPDSGSPLLDTAADAGPGPIPWARPIARPVIGPDDVAAVRQLLARWDGDLRSLLDGLGDAPRERA